MQSHNSSSRSQEGSVSSVLTEFEPPAETSVEMPGPASHPSLNLLNVCAKPKKSQTVASTNALPSERRPAISSAPHAKSTACAKRSALLHFDKIQHATNEFAFDEMGKCIDTLNTSDVAAKKAVPAEDEVEAVKFEVEQAVLACVTNACGNVQVNEDNGIKRVRPESLKNCLSSIVEHINKVVIPNNSPVNFTVFADDEGPNSLKGLQEKGRVVRAGEMEEGTNSLANHDCKVLTVTRDGNESRLVCDQFQNIVEVPDGTNRLSQRTLARNMFKDNVHAERLADNMNLSSCGRGGEPAAVSCDRMGWHDGFNVLAACWFQCKTRSAHPTTWINDRDCPELCVMTAFATCWIECDGLNRSIDPNSLAQRRTVLRVFHGTPVSTGGLNRALDKAKPKGTTQSVATKCTRKGSQSMMANNPVLTFNQVASRGAWKVCGNGDICTEKFISSTIASAHALGGWDNPNMQAVSPTIGCLSERRRQQMQLCAAELCPTQIPEFQPNGRLHPFLMVAHASLIMHFEHFFRNCGEKHPVVNKMICRLVSRDSSILLPADDPLHVLLEASRAIKLDFEQKAVRASAAASVDPALCNLFLEHRSKVDGIMTRMDTMGEDTSTMSESVKSVTNLTLGQLVEGMKDMQASMTKLINLVSASVGGGSAVASVSASVSSVPPTDGNSSPTHRVSPEKPDAGSAAPELAMAEEPASTSGKISEPASEVEHLSTKPALPADNHAKKPASLGKIKLEKRSNSVLDARVANFFTPKGKKHKATHPQAAPACSGSSLSDPPVAVVEDCSTVVSALSDRTQSAQLTINDCAPAGSLSAPRRSISVIDRNWTLRTLLEWMCQSNTFSKNCPMQGIIGNNEMFSTCPEGINKEKGKFQQAVFVAFLLLHPDERRALCGVNPKEKSVRTELGLPGTRAAVFAEVDDRWKVLHAMMTGKKTLSSRVKAAWQGVANQACHKDCRVMMGGLLEDCMEKHNLFRGLDSCDKAKLLDSRDEFPFDTKHCLDSKVRDIHDDLRACAEQQRIKLPKRNIVSRSAVGTSPAQTAHKASMFHTRQLFDEKKTTV